MRKILFFSFLFFSFLFAILLMAVSCTENAVQNKLDNIAAIVCSYPDSAAKELARMDDSELTTERLRAYHALLICESQYFSKCTFDDSIHAIAAEYFMKDKNSTSSLRMEVELLDIYKKIYTRPAESLYRLLEMEKHIDAFSTPHFKAMLESFILIIYYNSHEYEKMLNHAYKELKYAEEENVISKIVNSKIHIGIAYNNMNKLDSAYIYYSAYLEHEKYLDSATLSNVYHNMAVVIRMMDAQDSMSIEDFLLKSLSFGNSADSAKTYMQIANYYYNINEKKKADSCLNIFYKSIREDDYDSYYNMSRTLNNYYERAGNVDSANKYKGEMLKYRIRRDSAIRAGRVMEVTYQSEMEEIEEDSQTKIELTLIASAAVIGVLLFGIAVYRKQKNKLRKELGVCIENLDKTLAELDEVRKKENESKKSLRLNLKNTGLK